MKKVGLLLSLIMMASCLFSQETQEIQTIFNPQKGRVTHGGYGALSFGYTQLDGDDSFLFGIKGGWLLNHHITIGVAGYGFTNDMNADNDCFDNDPDEFYLAGGYGGLLLEPIIAPFYPVHVTFPLMIGAGGISKYRNCNWIWTPDEEWGAYVVDSDAFFIVEPGIELELNIVKFLRIAIGGSYRWTSNVSLEGYDGQLLHGFSGNLALKFGKF